MNVMNCRSCGRLFNVLGNEKLCPDCRKKLEDKFQEVKKYLEENPHSSMETVSRELEVSVKQIKQWVREERLEFAEGSVVDIACEKCGAPIRTGRFCDKCKAGMINTMNSVYKKPQAEQQLHTGNRDNPRMRYLDT